MSTKTTVGWLIFTLLRFQSCLIREIHDQCFPITKIKTKYNNRKPWLTEGLRSSIKSKNKLYRKYKKVDSVANETNYKLYKNKLKKCLISAEKNNILN